MTPITPFHLKDVIGKGTHGTVYRTYYAKYNKHVAVKVTPKTVASTMEVKMIQDLQNCRHVVKYIEHFDMQDKWIIVMDEVYGCDGTYLLELARHGIFLTELEIRNIARQLCEMICDCHNKSVMYGDMKPNNYIFTPPGKVTIVDFGCSRAGDNFAIPIGTPLYFSPQKFEQCYGMKSDIWSLGVLLYELTCGNHPYAFVPALKNDRDMLYQEIMSTQLTFYHPQWDCVSEEMQDLLRRMLDKNEMRRISSAQILQHPWWTM